MSFSVHNFVWECTKSLMTSHVHNQEMAKFCDDYDKILTLFVSDESQHWHYTEIHICHLFLDISDLASYSHFLNLHITLAWLVPYASVPTKTME